MQTWPGPVEPVQRVTSAGTCSLPIVYHAGSLLGLGYLVDRQRAERTLEGCLEPQTVLGKAFVLVCCFEYRETTIGPYNELGIGIQARRKGSGVSILEFLRDMQGTTDAGLWIASLPVSNVAAYAAGVELWGFPKYVSRLEMAFKAEETRISLGAELTIHHRRGPGLTAPGMPFVPYTLLAGRLLRTFVKVGHKVRFGGAGSVRVQVTGEGPTARVVKTLGLDSLRPRIAFRTDELRACLPEGVDVGPSQ
jgi:hypothetical protein